jgi:septum formation protein
MKIILASQSEYRKRGLELLGLKFEVKPADLDEKAIKHADPEKRVVMLAEAKARAIGEKEPDSLIVASDYFIVFEGKIYEKPADLAEAKQMLMDFSGKVVDNLCGVAVYNSSTKKITSAFDHCYMTFRKLSEQEIEKYIHKYPVTRFAGAFDTDGSILFSEKIEGEPLFAFGMPLSKLIPMLRKQGVDV